MLNSIVALSATLLSDVSSWDPASLNALPVRSIAPPILPDEPSTLALALIGIGIVGAYAGLQRWRRPQQPMAKSSSAPATSGYVTAEQQKRGAA